MNNQNPKDIIKQILAVVGHTKEEQETLADDFYRGMMQQSLITLIPRLPKNVQEEMKIRFAKGEQPIDIMEVIGPGLDEKMLTEHISAVSFKIMSDYLTEIMPKLTNEQKTALGKLFVN